MPTETYDVLIIGSGASGGMVAHELTRRGIKCLMLDAGPAVDFQKDRALKPVYELPYRGFGRPRDRQAVDLPSAARDTNHPLRLSLLGRRSLSESPASSPTRAVMSNR